MTEQTDYRSRQGEDDPFADVTQIKVNRVERRRSKIAAELDRNRDGAYRVPTWAMVVACFVIIAAFAAVVIFV
jgi:hypothetical protein